MNVPVFSNAIKDESLAGILSEVRQERTRKEFSDQENRTPITEHFNAEAIQAEKQVEPTPSAPDVKEKPFMAYDEQAEMFVESFDGLQSIGLSALAKKITFTSDEKKMLKDVKKKRVVNKKSLTEAENLLFEKWIMYKDLEENLELDDKQRKFLTKPLAKLLEKSQTEMKPEHALMIAGFTIAASKVSMLIAYKSDVSDMGNAYEYQKALDVIKEHQKTDVKPNKKQENE